MMKRLLFLFLLLMSGRIYAQTATTTTLAATPASPVVGNKVTFTATVSGSGATGSVTFTDGATTLSTTALASGTASYMLNGITTGTHSYTAVYSGDASFAGSTSSALSITPGTPVYTPVLMDMQGSLHVSGSVKCCN